MRNARIFSAQSEMCSSTQFLWCPSMGLAANCLEAIAGTCFRQVNLEILCSVWKPAHSGLAPCWHGHAPTLDSSTRWLWRSRDASVRASTQKNLRASMRKHCATGLRAPQAFENGPAPQAASCGRSDGPAVFLPSQGLPRTDRLQR